MQVQGAIFWRGTIFSSIFVGMAFSVAPSPGFMNPKDTFWDSVYRFTKKLMSRDVSEIFRSLLNSETYKIPINQLFLPLRIQKEYFLLWGSMNICHTKRTCVKVVFQSITISVASRALSFMICSLFKLVHKTKLQIYTCELLFVLKEIGQGLYNRC